MKYDLPCDVINDLLPSYVDRLTSEKSNEIIKEHLENCENCNSTYFAMLSDDESAVINVEEQKILKKTKNKIAKIIVSCVLVFALAFSGVWLFVNWYTTSDVLTKNDYEITVNKIDKKDITIKTNEVYPAVSPESDDYIPVFEKSMYFEGIESDYPLRDDLVDLINEQGFIYQIVISSDEYSIDEVYGGVLASDKSTRFEILSHHKNRFKKNSQHTYEYICFDDISAIYGYTEEAKLIDDGNGPPEVDNYELVWSAK